MRLKIFGLWGLSALLVFSGAPIAQAQAPTNVALPQISGTFAVGENLNATAGTWSFTPESFTYQWFRCVSQLLSSCNVINGATTTSYKLTEVDGRSFILISVTALNAGSGTTASSTFTSRILSKPIATTAPTIIGLPLSGSRLTLTLGTWSGASSSSYTYRWHRCSTVELSTCAEIPSASESTYLLEAADVGKIIRVLIKVLATSENLEGSAFSEPTSFISSEPISIAPPKIEGLSAVGEKITATTGTFAAYPEPIYSYQWQKCTSVDITSCSIIQNANAKELTLSASELNSYIRVMVTASNSLGVKGTPSALTNLITNPSAPSVLANPAISGVPVDRAILATSSGTWSGVPTPTTTAQWQVCTDAAGASCSDIAGATTATLKVTFADLGKFFRVKITATNRIGALSVNSNVVGPVTQATKLERVPTTFGFLQVGQEWSATQGTWSGTINPVFAFQWQRCADEKGASCTDIEGATKKSYTIQSADKGFYIRVKNWITDQATPAYSEILPVKIAAKPELPTTASPTASAPKPAVKKTSITCVKGKTTRKVTAVAPKCPTGFKKK